MVFVYALLLVRTRELLQVLYKKKVILSLYGSMLWTKDPRFLLWFLYINLLKNFYPQFGSWPKTNILGVVGLKNIKKAILALENFNFAFGGKIPSGKAGDVLLRPKP